MNHLFVLVHGLDGASTDLEFFGEELQASNPSILTLAPKCNHSKTRDGINAGAQRILDTIEKTIQENPQLEYISLVGHSLGGLYIRRLVYLAKEQSAQMDKLQPMYFITIATPHAGSLQLNRVFPLVPLVIPLVIGKTGSELLLLDKEQILLEMVNDAHLAALQRFKKRILYANVANDSSVHFSTSALLYRNPFKYQKMESGMVVQIGLEDMQPSEKLPESVLRMYDALNTLGWNKFGCYYSLPLAHVYIINKHLTGHKVQDPKQHQVIQHLLTQLET
ncbi:putative serine esterase-domain-containing protein [Gorgonomyces haynaldii]|nr:putative serine esterase-domain-containing protein [Gorgonomyces haynaldii]